MTGIQWTDETWNPTTGCDRVSPGCDNCYALTLAKRLKGMGSAKYQRDGDPRTSGPGFGLTTHDDVLDVPLRWKKPRRVFVNSMSDLFHAEVPDLFLDRVFDVMEQTPQHTYQVLTKRHGRMRSFVTGRERRRREYAAKFADCPTQAMRTSPAAESARRRGANPPGNIWLGVSAEDQKRADLRIPALLDTPAAVRFVSAEPLIGSLNLATEWLALDWLIVGGESGPGARPMRVEWADSLVNDCRALRIACFVKQLGSVWAGGGKGGDPAAWPEDLRVREFPVDAR